MNLESEDESENEQEEIITEIETGFDETLSIQNIISTYCRVRAGVLYTN